MLQVESPIDWQRFVEVIGGAQRLLLTSHIRPDCDALGSELGMAGVLDKLDKEVAIVNGQATPENLAFIDPQRRIKALGEDVQVEELIDGFDVMMVLDTSAWAQLGPMGEVLRRTKAKKIVLDHHRSEDDLGAEHFKNVRAEATGRLVEEAATYLGVTLTPEIATPLFAAVATDTGWFRFGSTSSGTFRLASRLVDAGARPDAIYNDLYEQETLARMRLRGAVLDHLVSELDGRFIHTYLLGADFDRTGAAPSDTEDAVNLALNVAGTEAAVILIEQPSGGFKVSFRSRCELDCSRLAEQFGGGGHKAAAGAFLEEPFESAQRRVLDAARQALE